MCPKCGLECDTVWYSVVECGVAVWQHMLTIGQWPSPLVAANSSSHKGHTHANQGGALASMQCGV